MAVKITSITRLISILNFDGKMYVVSTSNIATSEQLQPWRLRCFPLVFHALNNKDITIGSDLIGGINTWFKQSLAPNQIYRLEISSLSPASV